jgi:hypothetical protein
MNELLPGTLESLEIGLVRNGAVLPHLPSSLTSLTLHTSFEEGRYFNSISCPPRLVELSIRYREKIECCGDFPGFVASLPRHMEWLVIQGYINGMDFMPYLPPSLNHLSVGVDCYDESLPQLASLQEIVPHLSILTYRLGDLRHFLC